MFAPPSDGGAGSSQRRGRSTVPVDDPPPPSSPPPPTPAQILDAAAARRLDEAVAEATKYVKPACVPNHDFCRAKLLEAAAAFVTVKATADAARATGRGGSGPDAASDAPGMFAGAGMGVATGAMLGTAAAGGRGPTAHAALGPMRVTPVPAIIRQMP